MWLTAAVITGVSFGSGTTDWTVILSDASIFNCCAICSVSSASLKIPTYGLDIFWKQVLQHLDKLNSQTIIEGNAVNDILLANTQSFYYNP